MIRINHDISHHLNLFHLFKGEINIVFTCVALFVKKTVFTNIGGMVHSDVTKNCYPVVRREWFGASCIDIYHHKVGNPYGARN